MGGCIHIAGGVVFKTDLESKMYLFIVFILFMCLLGVHMPQQKCGGEKSNFRSWLSPSAETYKGCVFQGTNLGHQVWWQGCFPEPSLCMYFKWQQ